MSWLSRRSGRLLQFVSFLTFALLVSCQSQRTKDLKMDDKILKDREGNYYELTSGAGNIFYVEKIDKSKYDGF